MTEKVINGMKFCFDEGGTEEETAVAQAYKERLNAIAEHISNYDGFNIFFGNLSKSEIVAGLNEPTVSVMDGGGVLSYCNHSFDDTHIIELEFGGVLEDFYEVSIDG